MDELRITARPNASGDYDFDVYDARELFQRAMGLLNAERCDEAVPLFDRVAREFAGGRCASASLYNAGLCLQASAQNSEAARRYQRLLRELPDSPDVKDASFQLAGVLLELKRWPELVEVANELLARDELTSEERIEALARRAQGLLGAGDLEAAARQARGSLSYYRTRPDGQRIRDERFAAAANYVLAETIRLRGQALEFPEGGVEAQKPILIRRAAPRAWASACCSSCCAMLSSRRSCAARP